MDDPVGTSAPAPASAPASGSPAMYAPPTNTNIKSANSIAASEAGTELVKLKNVLNDGNFFLKPIFEEYDAYRAFQKGGRKGERPNTQRIDEARTKLAPIDLQAAFKGLAMIAGKNYTRTTPGAPFAAVGPFQGTQKALVGLKQKVVGATANGSTKKWWQIGKRKGGRRSVTRRQRQRR